MRAYTEIISNKTHYFDSTESYATELGAQLPSLRVAYRTWGTLNPQKDNVILICQALTGSADADAWWEGMFSREGRSMKLQISSSAAMYWEVVMVLQARSL